jgi:hypothetical protein
LCNPCLAFQWADNLTGFPSMFSVTQSASNFQTVRDWCRRRFAC